jgi:hypothetical protein
MLFGHCVSGGAHVEEYTTVLKQRGCRMVDQILLDALGQPG